MTNNNSTVEQPRPGLFTRVKAQLFRGGKALRHRNYRLFWTGQLISLIGTWMQTVAQSWLVLTLSKNDPLALGLISVAQFLPTTLLSLFSGVIADRYSKHRLLIITQSTAMALAVILGVLTVGGWVQLWHIYLCAFGLGLVNAFDMPTRQAFVSEMVGKEDLLNAVALNSTIFNAARVAGPAVAGLLIGLGEMIFKSTLAGVSLAVWLNAVSYIAVLIGLLRMNTSELHLNQTPVAKGSVFTNLKEGLVYIWNTPAILSLMLIVGAVGTFGFNFNVWMPVISRETLHVGAEGYGLLMGSLGFGALVSSLMLALSSAKPDLKKILLAMITFGIFEIGVAFSGFYWLSVALMFGVGLAMIRVNAVSNSQVQMNTPDFLRGRVMSVYLFVFAGTAPMGSLFMGWLANQLGTTTSMVFGGTLCIICAPLVLLYNRRAVARLDLSTLPVQAETTESAPVAKA